MKKFCFNIFFNHKAGNPRYYIYIQRNFKSSPKKCVNCSQLKMILSCRLLGHLFDDLFMIVVVGKHIEHTAACAPFIMLIDQD